MMNLEKIDLGKLKIMVQTVIAHSPKKANGKYLLEEYNNFCALCLKKPFITKAKDLVDYVHQVVEQYLTLLRAFCLATEGLAQLHKQYCNFLAIADAQRQTAKAYLIKQYSNNSKYSRHSNKIGFYKQTKPESAIYRPTDAYKAGETTCVASWGIMFLGNIIDQTN